MFIGFSLLNYPFLGTTISRTPYMASIAQLARIGNCWHLGAGVFCCRNCLTFCGKSLRSRAMAAFDLVLATWRLEMDPRYGQIKRNWRVDFGIPFKTRVFPRYHWVMTVVVSETTYQLGCTWTDLLKGKCHPPQHLDCKPLVSCKFRQKT